MIRKQVAIIYYWQQLLHQIPPIYIINYESCMKWLLLLFKRKTQTETHAMRHIIYIARCCQSKTNRNNKNVRENVRDKNSHNNLNAHIRQMYLPTIVGDKCVPTNE